MRAAVFLALILNASQAAAETPQLLHFENASSRAIVQIAIFPFENGEIIDDVLTAIDEPILPGNMRDIDTRLLRCAPISVWARFEDGEEISGQTDLCRNRRLRAFD